MSFDFDSSGVVVEDNLPWLGKTYPTSGGLTLFLDADYVPYNVGHCSKDYEYEAYQEALIADPAKARTLLNRKINHACFLLHDAMCKAKADSVLYFTTDSKTNFRTELTTHYKEQRPTEKPPFWAEVKAWLNSQPNVVMSNHNEADDQISIYANAAYKLLDADGVERTEQMYGLWSNIVIGSKDKDLDIIFGWHVDLATGKRYWSSDLGSLTPKMKIKEVTAYENLRTVNGEPVPDSYIGITDSYSRGARKGELKLKRVKSGFKEVEYIAKLRGTGFMFFCSQLLTGDTVDNYFGLPKYGATTAFNLLKDCTSKAECLRVVIDEYQKVYPDTWAAELTLQGRFAHMQTYENELWEIPKLCDL